MSKFNIKKKINLLPVLGEGHEASYLLFHPLSFGDARKLQKLQSNEDFSPELPPAPAEGADAGTVARYNADVKKAVDAAKEKENDAALKAVDKAIEFMQSKFIGGEISGEQVAKEDFANGELPVDVINYCMAELAGGNKPEGFTKA
jgi:hypothetical protein